MGNPSHDHMRGSVTWIILDPVFLPALMTLTFMGETCAIIAQYLVPKGYPSHLSHGIKEGRRNFRNEEGREDGKRVERG